jgi:hypothetical protein
LSSYLDPSVLLPTLITEPATEPVFDFLGADGEELLVSDFAGAEVASALSRLVRMALLTDADASARLADFDAWRAAMSLPVDIAASDARLAYVYAGASISGSERPTRCTSRLPDVSMRPSSRSIADWRPLPANSASLSRNSVMPSIDFSDAAEAAKRGRTRRCQGRGDWLFRSFRPDGPRSRCTGRDGQEVGAQSRNCASCRAFQEPSVLARQSTK